PPEWARLPGDEAPTFPPVDCNPGHLALDPATARCRCGSGPNMEKPKKIIPCTIYSPLRVFRTTIEVQPCATCPPQSRRYVGPDLREKGLFNFNNSRIFTHELLNDFTSAMTASETPFHSFHKMIQRKYIDTKSPSPFAANKLFRSVWYSFSGVQELHDSFVCDDCGVAPRTVLFDGITAGFNVKHATGSLNPPTMTNDASIIRDNV
ncbi:hypothetical protein AURDEDRAFT_28099, partial [Auricularia subglabra TFB-10046 SS5]